MDRINRSMQGRDSFSADRNGIGAEMTARKQCDFLLCFSAGKAYPMWFIQHQGPSSISSNLGFARQNQDSDFSPTRFVFEQLMLNQWLSSASPILPTRHCPQNR